ncbi:hypothetical protein G7Z17_g4475 [Cylindrodendrum hubeiense]|uniref:GH16 domain-containing protein n=1 Tax=Cylindrodendrum hubeiense TaxID=595255 RepID=A0A9P5LH55_9HYPO|nr:hypothetical protein G7Z17_g4475 [Cylindrodendrum hubeiense]
MNSVPDTKRTVDVQEEALDTDDGDARRGSVYDEHRDSTNPFSTPVFTTPIPSIRFERPISSTLSKTRPRRRFKSSRLVGELEKPWLDKSKLHATWDTIIFYTGVIIALGSFDWTTDDPANSYVDSEGLHIVPTLTTESTKLTLGQLNDGNATSGHILNPVRSARLTTSGKKTIKYGRVEVVAKMPAGDWMWPAIWMMPQDSVYGEWPRSGEIDIVETRGNDAEKYPLGNNIVSSALHWGTEYSNDAWRLSAGEWGAKRTKYSEGFHTFALEWSEKYLFTWLDGRLRQIVFFDFTKNKNLWEYGEFAGNVVNGTVPSDPWSQTGRSNTPFDQPFYLILNIAVGSTNGWFPDKPPGVSITPTIPGHAPESGIMQ